MGEIFRELIHERAKLFDRLYDINTKIADAILSALHSVAPTLTYELWKEENLPGVSFNETDKERMFYNQSKGLVIPLASVLNEVFESEGINFTLGIDYDVISGYLTEEEAQKAKEALRNMIRGDAQYGAED